MKIRFKYEVYGHAAESVCSKSETEEGAKK